MTPRRVLILGATGMLGHAGVAAFRSRFEVHAAVRDVDRAAEAKLDAELHRFDAWSDEIDRLIGAVRPEIVINCIGLVKQLREAARPRSAIRINALFPHEVAEACESVGARFMHVSTDCVFSGQLPLGSGYTEDDKPDAVDLYGLSKLLGEVGAPSLTVRTSIIGPELGRRSGLLEWFREQDGGAITGYRRAIFSGLTTRALAELLVTVAERHPDLAGVYHIAAEPISKYDLLLLLRDALAIECEVSASEDPVINRALDGQRFATATGLRVPSWPEMIRPLKETVTDVAAS
jgi:dTDP-4-dehydrorhamnose reductase